MRATGTLCASEKADASNREGKMSDTERQSSGGS